MAAAYIRVNLTTLRALYKQDSKEDKLFEPVEAVLPRFADIGNKVDYSSMIKSIFTFWLNDSKEIKLIIEQENKPVWSKVISGLPGLNQYRWNLITEYVENDMPYFIHYEKFIKAGEYNLVLETGGKRYIKPFKVAERN